MAIKRQDSFVRTAVANGTTFGTATDSNTWAQLSGVSTTMLAGTSGTQGTVEEGSGTSTALWQILGGTGLGDGEVLIRFELASVATSGTTGATTTDMLGLLIRASSTTNYMLLRYNNGSSGTAGWQYLRKSGGASNGGVAVSGTGMPTTPSANTLYWIRYRVVSGAISVKIWADTNGASVPTSGGAFTPSNEPSSWQWTGTESSVPTSTGAGVGIYALSQNTTTPTVKVDYFQYDDLTGSTVTASPAGQAGAQGSVTPTIDASPLAGQAGAQGNALSSDQVQAFPAGQAGAQGSVTPTIDGSPDTGQAGGQGSATSSVITPGQKTSGSSASGAGTGRMVFVADPASRLAAWSGVTNATTWQSGSAHEARIVALNANNEGFGLGGIPYDSGTSQGYGGPPFNPIYQYSSAGSGTTPDNAGTGGFNNDSHNLPGSYGSLTTTFPGGHTHVYFQHTSQFVGSEDVQTWVRTELGPTQTAVRRYIQGTGTDSNGVAWTEWACVSPVGRVYYTYQFVVPAGGLSLTAAADSFEVCGPASLLSVTGSTTQQGPFVTPGTLNGSNATPYTADTAHTAYGTVSTLSVTGGIPDGSSANTSGEPDFLALLPVNTNNTLSGFTIPGGWTATRNGHMVVKAEHWKDALAGTNVTAYPSGGFATLGNTSRAKAKWGVSPSSLPAGTYTIHLMEVIGPGITPDGTGSLAQARQNMLAYAADYLQPGTPVAGLGGTLQTFTYPGASAHPFDRQQGAYVVTVAAAGTASLTLDLGAGIQPNIRYSPQVRFEGFSGLTHADGSDLTLTWGGSPLSRGVDYDIAVDTAAQKAYVQLQFDVVSSGATTGQKNLAALAVAPAQVSVSPAGAAGAQGGVNAATVAVAPTGSAGAAGVANPTITASAASAAGAAGSTTPAIDGSPYGGQGGAQGQSSPTITSPASGQAGASGSARPTLGVQPTGQAGGQGNAQLAGQATANPAGQAGGQGQATPTITGTAPGQAGSQGQATPGVTPAAAGQAGGAGAATPGGQAGSVAVGSAGAQGATTPTLASPVTGQAGGQGAAAGSTSTPGQATATGAAGGQGQSSPTIAVPATGASGASGAATPAGTPIRGAFRTPGRPTQFKSLGDVAMPLQPITPTLQPAVLRSGDTEEVFSGDFALDLAALGAGTVLTGCTFTVKGATAYYPGATQLAPGATWSDVTASIAPGGTPNPSPSPTSGTYQGHIAVGSGGAMTVAQTTGLGPGVPGQTYIVEFFVTTSAGPTLMDAIGGQNGQGGVVSDM